MYSRKSLGAKMEDSLIFLNGSGENNIGINNDVKHSANYFLTFCINSPKRVRAESASINWVMGLVSISWHIALLKIPQFRLNA